MSEVSARMKIQMRTSVAIFPLPGREKNMQKSVSKKIVIANPTIELLNNKKYRKPTAEPINDSIMRFQLIFRVLSKLESAKTMIVEIAHSKHPKYSKDSSKYFVIAHPAMKENKMASVFMKAKL